MATHARFSMRTLGAMVVVLILLTGCGVTAGSFAFAVEPVDAAVVARTVYSIDGLEEGTAYQISLTVPDEWVGKFVTRNVGNIVYFDYVVAEGQTAPIFSVEALSFAQYWKTGAYPGEQTFIRSLLDTYIVYRMPIDAYYSGLPVDTFEAIAAQVPGVMTSLSVQAAPAEAATQ
jgi:hypothetical protein